MTAISSVDGRTAVSFGRQVPAATVSEESRKLEFDATVERVSVRIYRGAETTLSVTPLVRTADGNEFSLVELVGKQSVDGDDDKFIFDVSEPVEEGDEIVVRSKNNDGKNAHNYRVNVEIDAAGGVERVIDALGVA